MKGQRNRKTRLCAVAFLLVPALVHAQTVPALKQDAERIAEDKALPAVNLISTKRVHLDRKEAAGVALANRWKKHPERPRRGANGSVKYLYGATLPTLVCKPLEVCAIELEAGEFVNDLHTGDKVHWRIVPATTGKGADARTVLVVKPTDAGLVTSLLISTDRRIYSIKLVSTHKDWIPLLSFDYPDDVDKAWEAYRQQRAHATYGRTLSTGQSIANLDFGFSLSGDHPSWYPQRVYSDGVKTYIQLPAASFNDEAPALVALGRDGGLFSRPSEQLVNYRVIGDRYVVDKVLDRAALISGVGSDQQRVLIERRGGS
jgi:type IV secretion system protein TrbG